MRALGVVVVSLGLALACGAPEPKLGSQWVLGKTGLGQESVSAWANAPLAADYQAELVWTCGSAFGVHLEVHTHDAIQPKLGGSRSAGQVWIALDGGTPQGFDTTILDYQRMEIPAPTEVLTGLGQHETLVVTWQPIGDPTASATFDLTGIDAPLQQAMDACGWPKE